MRIIAALALALATALPAAATPESPDYVNGGQCAGDQYSKCRYSLDIVNPSELMVLVPNLEYLGYSRISSVEHCAELTNTRDWTNLMTDAEFDGMESCLIEHT